MSKASRTVIGLAIVGATAFGVWKAGTALLSSSEDAASTKHLVNQFWIERLPQSRRDMVGHLALIDHRQGKFGGAGRSSQWRHFLELFAWKLDGHKLGVFFPQEEVRGTLKVRTWDCKGEAPDPFELCLELAAQNGQKVVYYSKRDWVIEPHSPEASLEDMKERVPELAGVFEGVTLSELDADLATDGTDFTEVSGLGPLAPTP
jgi:hypothetical protein